ncbi:flagellar inner arm dynein 1 heavy chain alpha [Reticulomyxa filosa]|uniref:Flagellar inner arm dynein 1 heavy chain alpha n=1 Tax=Reticulomyxa filosa TaxID=46433 RepID=X6N1Y9_RETFI|nr:flagellar inner arm dynein 1 heavy chain alpha [Reticulomyxa filosa]|eukprot:ETO20101.1 flagellar inner arm dynein 1 heavy chain alpha [Reticulomyxa filosa]
MLSQSQPFFFFEIKKGVTKKQRNNRASIDQGNCWNHFINRCRDHLHIVLTMIDIELRNRLVFPWPKDALYAVAEQWLIDEQPDGDTADKVTDEYNSVNVRAVLLSFEKSTQVEILNHMVKVHLSVKDQYSPAFELEFRRKNHVTPKNYLDFLHNYKKQLGKFRLENITRIEKLEAGLNQLTKASQNVNSLRSELTKQNEVVTKKSEECHVMIEQIKERTNAVNEKKIIAGKKNEDLQADAKEIIIEKKLAEDALEEALPTLELAREALKNLRKEDIAEIKVLNNPKEAVKNVCLCVLNLRPSGTEDVNEGWTAARAMMGDANFLQRLQKFNFCLFV